MKKLNAVLFLAVCLVLFSVSSYGQGDNGRWACKTKTYVSYYKITPGKYDEWLYLFKKWHLPLVQYGIDNKGVEWQFYAAWSHSISADWDFAAIYTESAESAKPSLTRSQLIIELFGDNMDEYIAGEKRRWELTVKQWDNTLVPMDPYQEPFSVFLPVDDTCEAE